SLIRTKNANEEDYSTIFCTNFMVSVAVYSVIYLCAPFIAVFYKQPILTHVIRFYSLTFIIGSFTSVQIALLSKKMKFKTIMLCNLPGVILGIVIGLVMAYENYGIWSIVSMYLITQLSQGILLWFFSDWKPKLVFSKIKLKQHFQFGYKLTLSGLTNAFFINIYNILIGRFYPIQTLGYYDHASNLNLYPVTAITSLLSKITYPLLAKIQDEKKRVSVVYQQLLQASFFITAPLLLGAACIATPLFDYVLGEKWLPSVPFFQILCVARILYPVHSLNINILKVYGRTDLFLKLEIIKKIIALVCIFIGFFIGIYGLLFASVVSSFVGLFINTHYSGKMINYGTKKQMKDMLPSLIVSSGMCLMIYVATLFTSHFSLKTQIVLPSLIGITGYVFLSFLFNKLILVKTLNFFRSRFKIILFL
ncbi:MAG: lipopolysaccharide biosynthesis protein, partial [Flavobacteriaceae bacterium]